jgi:hypothetical protein
VIMRLDQGINFRPVAVAPTWPPNAMSTTLDYVYRNCFSYSTCVARLISRVRDKTIQASFFFSQVGLRALLTSILASHVIFNRSRAIVFSKVDTRIVLRSSKFWLHRYLDHSAGHSSSP